MEIVIGFLQMNLLGVRMQFKLRIAGLKNKTHAALSDGSSDEL